MFVTIWDEAREIKNSGVVLIDSNDENPLRAAMEKGAAVWFNSSATPHRLSAPDP